MSVGLEGDVIIVTGGAGGLGSAYSRLLARHGARVVVNDTGGLTDGRGGDPVLAEQVAADIVAGGGAAVGDPHDGSTTKGAKAIVNTALEAFGRVDGVIANAGLLRDRTFAKLTDDDIFAVIDAHLAGTTRVFHAAWPYLQQQGYGRLVATSSASGLFGSFGQSNYAAAKMGIVGLTQVIAQEGHRHGITANVIAPIARTRLTEGLMGTLEAKAGPELVAPLVAYLMSRRCGVSGRIYSVGAGRIARVDVGVTRGLTNPDMDVDWVADNIEAIDSESEYLFPEVTADESAMFE